jgi:uncharacterized coiled-coil protein SlyX
VKDGVWIPLKVALVVVLLGPKFHKYHRNSRLLRHKNKKCLGPKFNQMLVIYVRLRQKNKKCQSRPERRIQRLIDHGWYLQKSSSCSAGENPIKKIRLVVSGDDGELYLDELNGAQDGAGGVENGAGNGGVRREAVLQERILGLESQVAGQNRRLDAMGTMIATHDAQRHREFEILNGNIRRVAVQPVARRANNQEAGWSWCKASDLSMPAHCAQTHAHFIIYGRSMSAESVVARQRLSLLPKSEEGWSTSIVEERLFGIAFLRLFELASRRK